jgi:hypothetical protein
VDGDFYRISHWKVSLSFFFSIFQIKLKADHPIYLFISDNLNGSYEFTWSDVVFFFLPHIKNIFKVAYGIVTVTLFFFLI